jgi:long-chain fatty acid transport protein
MRTKCLVVAVLILCLGGAGAALATNGDNMIGISPIANSMGGVGIAAPQDAISAVFANPAAMCFGPYCPATEANFAGTLFMPHIEATVIAPGAGVPNATAHSETKVFVIPSVGFSMPLTDKAPFWRFGLGAFGTSGLGVDYRDTALDSPAVAGKFTNLQIMKFAPAIAVQPTDQLSLGLAAHIDYGMLDLERGTSQNFGLGAQVGMIYKVTDQASVGLTYVSPQNVDHKHVVDFEQDGTLDTLKLESPQQVGIGFAYSLLDYKLLLGLDLKWINWSGANGYGDFDWEDQWVVAVGAQYKVTPKLTLRAGYNYGNNPVKEHAITPGFANIQGHIIPAIAFEEFRIVGFPAFVEHHLTVGGGYQFTPRLSAQLGYMHAFAKTVTETGRAGFPPGPILPASISSTLSEDAIDLELTIRF